MPEIRGPYEIGFDFDAEGEAPDRVRIWDEDFIVRWQIVCNYYPPFDPENPMTMKPIPDQAHHDGHGLADLMTIYADERDPNAGGASHHYVVEMPSIAPGHDDYRVASIQFQHGPRTVPESKPGILDGVLLAIEIDRLRAFQEGPFRCKENACALTHMEEALMWIQKRAHDRARRGVLGTLQK